MSFSSRDWLNGATDVHVRFVQVSALESQVWLIDTRLHFLDWIWRWRHFNLLKPWLFAQRHTVIIPEDANFQQLGCEYLKPSTWCMSSLMLWFVFCIPHCLCVSIHSAFIGLYAVGSQSVTYLMYCVLSEINFLYIILATCKLCLWNLLYYILLPNFHIISEFPFRIYKNISDNS